MGNSPGVVLDFSKAQKLPPLPVTLDKSTLRPINASGPVTLDKSTLQPITLDFTRAVPLPPPSPSEMAFKPMPANQPSPAARGGYFLPRFESPAEAKGGAAQVALGLATAGTAGAVSSLASPTAEVTSTGTGILNAAGEEIMREGIKLGPSALSQAIQHPLGQLILKEAFRGALVGAGGAAGAASVWKALKMLGIISP